LHIENLGGGGRTSPYEAHINGFGRVEIGAGRGATH
jgi:hypothetical protein